MFREVLHSRRGDLLAILRGLHLQIAKDRQLGYNEPSRLDAALRLIEEELQLRPDTKENTVTEQNKTLDDPILLR